jgi:hypothetical protein
MRFSGMPQRPKPPTSLCNNEEGEEGEVTRQRHTCVHTIHLHQLKQGTGNLLSTFSLMNTCNYTS